MLSILRKEVNTFFSSLIGYVVIGVFLVTLGLFLWVFPDTNLLDPGYASLDYLFAFAPNILMFLIPAITMRTFAEEQQTGTIEFLATRPITDLEIILGKYFASLILVFFAIIPTFIYFWTIHQLGSPVGNIDSGSVWGSYFGLFFLGAVFVAIGIFASSITTNQIVAFVLGVFLCFFFYLGFDFLSNFPVFVGTIDYIVEMFGIDYHYKSISRGVLDTRDFIYFSTIIIIFIGLTKLMLERRSW
ncbi:MAG: ABC-2 type transport system permease protein [Cognaticolwellia sp.]|jgi:ABC-2 type transport system permease protein